MDYKPWMDLIKPEDMPNDDLKFIAESAGIKSALALIFCSPGLTVSIPKNPFREIKEKYIMSQYDGRKIYKIIKKNLHKKHNLPKSDK